MLGPISKGKHFIGQTEELELALLLTGSKNHGCIKFCSLFSVWDVL